MHTSITAIQRYLRVVREVSKTLNGLQLSDHAVRQEV